jgi:hypothetical protein
MPYNFIILVSVKNIPLQFILLLTVKVKIQAAMDVLCHCQA